MRSIAITLVALAVVGAPAAAATTCEGPPECCTQAVHGTEKHDVALGVVVMGLANLSEKDGTCEADFYLYEEWTPAPGFTPVTEIVNEVKHEPPQFDTTLLREGKCLRSRRMHSTLRVEYDLRRFPFDRQELALDISDDEYSSSELVYDSTPYSLGFDDGALAALSSWKIDDGLTFTHEARAFKWERGAPPYDNARIEFGVRRHVTFHLFKYFLPLLLIVGLAFSVFWIDPADLSAAATVGVTCLLAAIAFQFAEASSLPAVSYMTLADRVYVVCYVAIGLALFETVYTNRLAGGGQKARADRIDRRCRSLFPAAVVVALAISVVRAFTEAH